MWYINLHLYVSAALLLAMVITYWWFLTYPLDSAEARRRAFPILGSRRSHPTPQVGWHPAQKITKKPDGSVDDLKIERNLKAVNGYYITQKGGLRVFWQSYRPKKLEEVTHGYVLLHGYGAHSDYTIRQRALMISQLNNAWVFTFDYPGHGRSDGLWAFISDWKLLIRQCSEIIEFEFLPKVTKLKKPMFCLGFSQGGAVGIHLCMLRPKLFRGIVLISPMCGIADELHPSPYLTKILTFISWFAGKLRIVPKKDLQKLIFKDRIVWRSLYLESHRDRLGYTGVTRLATAREMLRASSETINRAVTEMKTQFILFHGDNDYLCPIKKSRQFYEAALVKDKTFEDILGGWHGLSQCDMERVFKKIFIWTNKRIG